MTDSTDGTSREEESLEARLMREARERDRAAARQRRMAEPTDYVYDKAQEKYWDLKDGSLHGEEAVDASIPEARWRVVVEEGDAEPAPGEARPRGRPRRRRERLVRPSIDIRRIENDQFVESSTWWPGEAQIIRDAIIDRDGWRAAPGRRAYNTFRPPPEPEPLPKGQRGAPVSVWTEHVVKLFPDPREHEHFFNVVAHMIQHPEEKCNTATVLSGTQGIGKDAALAPVRAAIGAWNSKNIDPDELFSPYKPWLEVLMLVIDEVRLTRDEFHASNFYNILKPMVAAPPDTLAVNDKYVKLRHIVNVLRVFITTNDWLAMYIPQNDRRMFIMNSPMKQNWHLAEGRPDYFTQYWAWLRAGGEEAVGRWLRGRDLSAFNPKAPPPRTAAWGEVAASWDAGDDVVTKVLEELRHPDVLFATELTNETVEAASFDHREELRGLMKSPRRLFHRMFTAGYVNVPCPLQRWDFRGPKFRFRTKHAFVRRELGLSAEAAVNAVYAHGAALSGEASKVVDLAAKRPEKPEDSK